MSVRVISIGVGAFATNSYLVIHEMTKDAFLIDPGDDADRLTAAIVREGVKLCAILLTHGHLDHFLAAEQLIRTYGVPIYTGEKELPVLLSPEENLTLRFLRRPVQLKGAIGLRDGEEITFADTKLKVIFTPGHTRGGCCYYLPKEGILFSGDTLFYRSVGNTSFPGGDTCLLMQSIKERLYSLPKETYVYPGHGESTDIGSEMEENPFVPAGRRKDR